MESANLNSSPRDDAEFEALLRRTGPELPDDGFRERVLLALPSHATTSFATAKARGARRVACAVGALAGIVVAVVGLVSTNSPAAAAEPWRDSIVRAAHAMNEPGFALAVVVTLLTLGYAMKDRLLRRI